MVSEYKMNQEKCDVGMLVFVSDATLEHKKSDGLKEYGDYVFWYGSKVPKRIVELLPTGENMDRVGCNVRDLVGDDTGIFKDKAHDLTDFDVRLYFQVNGQVRGYFNITSFTYADKSYEIRFFSDDWHEIKDGEMKKGHQGWEYYACEK